MRKVGIGILAGIALALESASWAQSGASAEYAARQAERDLRVQFVEEDVSLAPPRAVKIKRFAKRSMPVQPSRLESTVFVDPVTVNLRLDDGGSGAVVGPGYPITANRLTPPKYPATLTSIVFVISGNGDTHVPRDIDLNIVLDPAGSDLGPTGPTSEVFLEMTVELEDASFLNTYLTLELPPELLTTIYCGDLYLVLRDPTSEGMPYFLDTTVPQGRSWVSFNNGNTFTKLPTGIFSDGSWFLRGDVQVEREPCDFAKLAGSWVVNTYKGCPAAKFSVDATGHIGACCGLPNAQFYGYPCGANASCTTTNTTNAINLTVNPSTCGFTIASGGFVPPACLRHNWEFIFLDGNTVVQKYTSEGRTASGGTCPAPNTCTFEHPISGHEGFPTGHPALEATRDVTLGPTKSEIHWALGPADVTSYRVLRGDLSCIKTPVVPSDPLTCLTPAGLVAPPALDPTPTPASGACSAAVRGYYYLVQPVTLRQKGSLNTCAAFQEQPRNEHPTGDCP